MCVRHWWFGDVEQVWATSTCRLLWRGIMGYYKKDERKSMLKKCFSSCMDNMMQELPWKELLSLFIRWLVASNKSFFSPTSTLDVALQIQSVALELHHPCLVFTQSAHRTWFPFVMFTTEVETGGCCHLSSVQHDLSMMSMFYNLTLLLEMCSVVSMSHTFECFQNPFVLKGIATQIEHAPVFWGSV